MKLITKNYIHLRTHQKVHNTSQIGGIYTLFGELKGKIEMSYAFVIKIVLYE